MWWLLQHATATRLFYRSKDVCMLNNSAQTCLLTGTGKDPSLGEDGAASKIRALQLTKHRLLPSAECASQVLLQKAGKKPNCFALLKTPAGQAYPQHPGRDQSCAVTVLL